MQKIVFHKLLGFGTLTSDGVDFSDATGAKLGAKVGDPETSPRWIDFKDETLVRGWAQRSARRRDYASWKN